MDSVSGSVSAADSGVSRGLCVAGLECSSGAMPVGAMYELLDFEKNLNDTFETHRIGECVRFDVQHSFWNREETHLCTESDGEARRLSSKCGCG